MWRRVPCQHQLNMGESVLSPRINFLCPRCSAGDDRAVVRGRRSGVRRWPSAGGGLLPPGRVGGPARQPARQRPAAARRRPPAGQPPLLLPLPGHELAAASGRERGARWPDLREREGLGEAGCSGEREHGNHSVTCVRTDSVPSLDREGPGRMCDESWQRDLACVHWRLVRGRVFFSVLGPVIPGNHMQREGDDGM